MNRGRVEQVDAPYTIYARPKTRFVAGFIGRTNFLEGRREGQQVAFDSFAVDAARLEGLDGHARTITASVRPQSLTLTATLPAASQALPPIQGRIAERTFLGEYWDYVFAAGNSPLRVKVAARPTDVFDIDADVWLVIDPRHMVVIP